MIVKISDIADAQGGLVLSRKEEKIPVADTCHFKRLTLRSLSDNGFINKEELEDFYSADSLSNALFTSLDDVVIRLFSPVCPAMVGKDDTGLLIPSQLAVLKVKKNLPVLPEYLRLCLAQREIQERVLKVESGTAQRTVKLGTIMDLQISVPDLETQRKAVQIDILSRKRERMYQELILQERLLTEKMLEDIIGGALG